MAVENIPAPAPTRSDDQILPFAAWLGYPEVIHFASRMAMNNLYQPWRAILSMINQCLTGKTSRHDRSRYPVLHILWGIITSLNVDFAELIWEKFVQAILTFLTDKTNLGCPTKKGRKDKPHVISYCRFTKLIICHLGRIHNIHQRSTSPFHLVEEDLRLGNLKFVPKGKEDEVFGMPIPYELISNNIRNAPYYNAYLEMVSKHDQKVAAEKEGKKKIASAKQPKSKSATEKSSKPAPASKPKHAKEKPSKPSTAKPPKPKPAKATPLQKAGKGKVAKAQGHTHVGGVAIQEPVAEATRPVLVVKGKGKAIVTEEQVDDTSANIVRDTLSPADAEIGDDVTEELNLEDKTAEIDEDPTGSDPGETHESRPPPEQVFMDEDQVGPDPGVSGVALARPDLEPTYDEFMADLYPKVQESLKFPADEHVVLEEPLSSFRIVSSMKNLDDAYTIGDQFINDKATEDEPEKLNVESKVVSMVTVPIYQASSSVPPMSTPVIDLLPPKPAPSTTQAPVFTATTSTTTTTRLLPPPPQQQIITYLVLAARVTSLKQKFAAFEQKSKTLDNMTQNLGSRVFTLELRDLPHKIDEAVRENVKEVIQIALQAPLRDRFRNLPEADMKEMLHQRMFETGSYQSLLEHIILYEALEAYMERAHRDEFFAEQDKSHKRRRDDQDPPPPPLDSDLNKKKQHDSGASGSSQPPTPQSSTWKTTNTREAPSTSSKQHSTHLPKNTPRPKWLKPIPAEDGPATPEPAWVIPTSHIPDAIRDMQTFMNWYCQKMGKTELTQADLERQAYEVVKAFYLDVVHL
ncbi:hypothetical protein Tco_0420685 [Tanacetum coccineum]